MRFISNDKTLTLHQCHYTVTYFNRRDSNPTEQEGRLPQHWPRKAGKTAYALEMLQSTNTSLSNKWAHTRVYKQLHALCMHEQLGIHDGLIQYICIVRLEALARC
eukprot:6181705-Pleurochrysis_carterae.AAC.2